VLTYDSRSRRPRRRRPRSTRSSRTSRPLSRTSSLLVPSLTSPCAAFSIYFYLCSYSIQAEEVGNAHPRIVEAVETMITKGKWTVPGMSPRNCVLGGPSTDLPQGTRRSSATFRSCRRRTTFRVLRCHTMLPLLFVVSIFICVSCMSKSRQRGGHDAWHGFRFRAFSVVCAAYLSTISRFSSALAVSTPPAPPCYL
jgi:hypothetical protein